MHRDQLHIAEPCHADWKTMSGDSRKRFCGSCTKHVHDLSAMTEPDAVDLLETMRNLCVRYAVGADGQVIHAPPRRTRVPRILALGAALLGSVPAFASGAVAQPSQPSTEPGLMERVLRRAQVAVGLVPEATEAEVLEGQVRMGDVAVLPPPPPPPPPPVMMGRMIPPPTIDLPPPVVPPPVIPLPSPGETVIPEVEEAIRDQAGRR